MSRKYQPLTAEHKAKIKQAMLNRSFSQEHRDKLSIAQLGNHPSDETRQKMSVSHQGPLSSEVLVHRTETRRRNNVHQPWLGKKFSDEHKSRLSTAHQGKILTEEHKAKIVRTGMIHSEETRVKMRKALHTHHIDLDTTHNVESNLVRNLKNGEHQRLHRLAYHYLLEKYGVDEVKKYIQWFMSQRRGE